MKAGPDDELTASIAPDVMRCLLRAQFFQKLDDLLRPNDDSSQREGCRGDYRLEAVMNRILWVALLLLMAVPAIAQQSKPPGCVCGKVPFNPYGCPGSTRDNSTPCTPSCDHKTVDSLTHQVNTCNADKAKDPLQKDLTFQNLRIVEDTKEIGTLQQSGGNASKIQQLQNDIAQAKKKIAKDLAGLQHWNCNDLQQQLDNAEKQLAKCENPTGSNQ